MRQLQMKDGIPHAVISVELFHELAHGLDLPGSLSLGPEAPRQATARGRANPRGVRSEGRRQGHGGEGWVPQPEVLAHPAVGSFPDPLRAGVERGYGEVPRAEEDGEGGGGVHREGVAETVRFVAADAAGEPVGRRRGVRGGLSDYALQKSYVDGLAQCLVENKDKLRP
ncbi:unnamed protein product [Spirodela intermedia]|uniref:Uncharacterized protein n=1 Tax=Spirodela intermedia TaxID=51605 RepID=A0ABN7EC67_SPIIN|nr:unnamed protein product [Spirodela intermedia]